MVARCSKVSARPRLADHRRGTYSSFPYVILMEPPESCDYLEGLWDDEILEPEVASGCFDPLEETVNVQLDVFSVPTFYRIIMNNEP
ncbi:MAG: hypothetical protein RL685_2927 [Pseudomonadota bacterium]|jgi:hypothetical protein